MSVVNSATSTASTIPNTSTASVTSNAGNQLDKDAFLKLLVTQLKYQDPTKPMEDQQFISQMAQFSSLEQMTNVSTGLNNLSNVQSTLQSAALVGRTVELKNPQGGDNLTGTVDKVKIVDGQPHLIVGEKEYTLSDLVSVR